jgi:hypothetical protein
MALKKNNIKVQIKCGTIGQFTHSLCGLNLLKTENVLESCLLSILAKGRKICIQARVFFDKFEPDL